MVRLRPGLLRQRGDQIVGRGGDAFGDVARLWDLGDGDEPAEPPLLTELADRTEQMMFREDVDDELLDRLDLGWARVLGREPGAAPEATAIACRSAAGVGYMARCAESERLVQAPGPDSWTASADVLDRAMMEGRGEGRSGGEMLAGAAAWLASPKGMNGSSAAGSRPGVTIPGLTADERTHLQERTLPLVAREENGRLETPQGPVDDVGFAELRRLWNYGFFLRSLQEYLIAGRERP